jgi:hypothetical protein
MADRDQELSELEAWLGGTVGRAYAAALAIDEPAGTSPAWEAMLEQCKVDPLPADARRRTATATGLLRGASPEELHLVLERIVKRGNKKLAALDVPVTHEQAFRRWDRLRGLLFRLRDETLAAYRKQVLPVQGMFAHARAAAAASAAQTGGQPAAPRVEAFVLLCSGCGAPRLKPTSSECEYCGARYGG